MLYMIVCVVCRWSDDYGMSQGSNTAGTKVVENIAVAYSGRHLALQCITKCLCAKWAFVYAGWCADWIERISLDTESVRDNKNWLLCHDLCVIHGLLSNIPELPIRELSRNTVRTATWMALPMSYKSWRMKIYRSISVSTMHWFTPMHPSGELIYTNDSSERPLILNVIFVWLTETLTMPKLSSRMWKTSIHTCRVKRMCLCCELWPNVVISPLVRPKSSASKPNK